MSKNIPISDIPELMDDPEFDLFNDDEDLDLDDDDVV